MSELFKMDQDFSLATFQVLNKAPNTKGESSIDNNITSNKVTPPSKILNPLFSRLASMERQIQESNPNLSSVDVKKMLSESIQKKVQQASQSPTNAQMSGEQFLGNTADPSSLPHKIEYWDLTADSSDDGDENAKGKWKLVRIEGIQRPPVMEKGSQFNLPTMSTENNDANVSSETVITINRKRKARTRSVNESTQPLKKRAKDVEEKFLKQLEQPQVNPTRSSIPPPTSYGKQPTNVKDSRQLEQEQRHGVRNSISPPTLYDNQPLKEEDVRPLEQELLAVERLPYVSPYKNQLVKETSTPLGWENPAAVRDAVMQPTLHANRSYPYGHIAPNSAPGSNQFYHTPQVSPSQHQAFTPSQYRQPQPSLYEQHMQHLHQRQMQQQHPQLQNPSQIYPTTQYPPNQTHPNTTINPHLTVYPTNTPYYNSPYPHNHNHNHTQPFHHSPPSQQPPHNQQKTEQPTQTQNQPHIYLRLLYLLQQDAERDRQAQQESGLNGLSPSGYHEQKQDSGQSDSQAHERMIFELNKQQAGLMGQIFPTFSPYAQIGQRINAATASVVPDAYSQSGQVLQSGDQTSNSNLNCGIGDVGIGEGDESNQAPDKSSNQTSNGDEGKKK